MLVSLLDNPEDAVRQTLNVRPAVFRGQDRFGRPTAWWYVSECFKVELVGQTPRCPEQMGVKSPNLGIVPSPQWSKQEPPSVVTALWSFAPWLITEWLARDLVGG